MLWIDSIMPFTSSGSWKMSVNELIHRVNESQLVTFAFFSPTPATNFFVSRGIFELVNKNFKDLNLREMIRWWVELRLDNAYPWIDSIPLLRPKPARTYPSAPPNTETLLSTPLGLPCRIFSAMNAHRLTSSAVAASMARRPSWDTWRWSSDVGAGSAGIEMRRCASSAAVAAHTE